MYNLDILDILTQENSMYNNYLVRVCATELCVWSSWFVYVCMYVCVIICGQKRAVYGLTTGKSPVSVMYCLLVEFYGQKGGLLHQAIHSGKEIWNHSINGIREGSGKLYYGKACLVYMQCNYAMLKN